TGRACVGCYGRAAGRGPALRNRVALLIRRSAIHDPQSTINHLMRLLLPLILTAAAAALAADENPNPAGFVVQSGTGMAPAETARTMQVPAGSRSAALRAAAVSLFEERPRLGARA